MDYIFGYIKEHNITIDETIQNISLNERTIQYILRFDIPSNFDLHIFDKCFNNDPSLQIFLNHILVDELNDVKEILEELDEDELIKIQIIKKYNVFLDKILLYSSESIIKFIGNLVKSKISYIAEIQKKIVLVPYITNTKYSFESSIFEIEKFDNYSSDSIENIDSHTKKFIKKFKKTKAPIILIPDIINEDIFKNFTLFPIITSILGILASEKNGNDFNFKSTFTFKIVAIDTINYSQQEKYEHFILLKEIFEYIFISTSTSDQKLTFFRKAFCETIKKDTEIQLNELDPEKLKEIYLDTKFLFDTFEAGEVSGFLKEKKDALKEYLSLAKDISKYIDSLQDNIVKNIIAILGLVITHSLFRVRLNMSIQQNIVVLFCIFIFIIITWVLFSYKEHKKHVTINADLLMLNKHFAFLSSKSDEVKKDMNNLVKKNISTLEHFTWIVHIIYLILFILIITYLTLFIIKLL